MSAEIKPNAEACHAAILDDNTMLIADIVTGEIYWVSPLVERMFGYQMAGALKGQRVEMLIPTRLRHLHRLHRKAYEHHPYDLEMGIDKNGTPRKLIGVKRDGSEFGIFVSGRARVIETHGKTFPCVVLTLWLAWTDDGL